MIILNDVFYIWFGFIFNRNLKKKKGIYICNVFVEEYFE